MFFFKRMLTQVSFKYLVMDWNESKCVKLKMDNLFYTLLYIYNPYCHRNVKNMQHQVLNTVLKIDTFLYIRNHYCHRNEQQMQHQVLNTVLKIVDWLHRTKLIATVLNFPVVMDVNERSHQH